MRILHLSLPLVYLIKVLWKICIHIRIHHVLIKKLRLFLHLNALFHLLILIYELLMWILVVILHILLNLLMLIHIWLRWVWLKILIFCILNLLLISLGYKFHLVNWNCTLAVNPFALNCMSVLQIHYSCYTIDIFVGYKTKSSRLLSTLIFQNYTIF